MPDAETNANVYLTIVGFRGDTGRHQLIHRLSANTVKFARRSVSNDRMHALITNGQNFVNEVNEGMPVAVIDDGFLPHSSFEDPWYYFAYCKNSG